jgi:hypothetical protein
MIVILATDTVLFIHLETKISDSLNEKFRTIHYY